MTIKMKNNKLYCNSAGYIYMKRTQNYKQSKYASFLIHTVYNKNFKMRN